MAIESIAELRDPMSAEDSWIAARVQDARRLHALRRASGRAFRGFLVKRGRSQVAKREVHRRYLALAQTLAEEYQSFWTALTANTAFAYYLTEDLGSHLRRPGRLWGSREPLKTAVIWPPQSAFWTRELLVRRPWRLPPHLHFPLYTSAAIMQTWLILHPGETYPRLGYRASLHP